jgi:hypothetical protein
MKPQPLLLLLSLVAGCGAAESAVDRVVDVDVVLVDYQLSASASRCADTVWTPSELEVGQAMRCVWQCALHDGELGRWTLIVPTDAERSVFLVDQAQLHRDGCG